MALLAWAPIPLGSNRPWAWMALEIGAFGLAGLWCAAWAVGAVRLPDAARAAWPAWLLLAAWLALQALYVVPLPPDTVAWLSPESARVQGLADAIGAHRELMTLSIDPHASQVSLLESCAYVAVFFLTLALVNRRARLLRLAQVLVGAAVIHATYAVFMHLYGASGEWFGTRIAHFDSASGTYANRNHFAGFLEMSLALGIGLLIAGISERRADDWRRFLRSSLEWVLGPKMLLRLGLCVLVIALTTTHSRMGNIAFFASLLVAGAAGLALSRHATRNTVILLASLVAIDLFIVGSWFGVEKLARRIEQTTAADVRQREEPAAYAIPIIRDYAPWGTGPGTFYVAFPKYRPPEVANFYEYTHNDYVQLASESGLAGLAVIGLFVALSIAAALAAQWRRRDPLMRGMSFACVMGATSILIHSWTDFNLQIPANAAFFMVLLALGWIALYRDRQSVPGLANVREEGR
ncbi:MAG TPA: O-antigen ligase family protein [Usitatibacter sp.]|nr:O-antigen ligase family protein [Usitatibacter sp.]